MSIVCDSKNVPLQKAGQEYSFEHTGTDPTYGVSKMLRGDFNISIVGTWEGSITIEVSRDRHTFDNDAAAAWRPVKVFTDADIDTDLGAIETTGWEPASNPQFYRTAANLSSGSAVANLYQ